MTAYQILNIPFPEKEIFLRLGGHLTKTELTADERCRFLTAARKAYNACRPCGRWEVFEVKKVASDGIELIDGEVIPGGDFASRVHGITHLWCGAITVGKEVSALLETTPSVSEKAIYDAAASETADETMDALHRLAQHQLQKQNMMINQRRYSPGYGDMPLAVQEFFFSRLRLSELGMTLNEIFYISPEKSVTAFAGIYSKEC